MTFTSFEFLLFFPVVVLLYNIIPQKWRLIYLLAVSYAFYAFLQPIYLILLAAVTATTYGFTRWMENIEDEDKKHRIMIWGIIVILLPLFFFKYFNFVDESITSLFQSLGISIIMPTIRWILPLGISYYTFMAIGYLVDVYNEDVEVEHNVCAVGLFLSFFPIVLSGPIERAGNIFPQIKAMERSKPIDLTSGAKLMLWGYFMKLCVADRLGIYIDAVYSNVAQHNGTSLALAALLFPIQEYGDLGGYSLLAIGTARCLGFKIVPNFNRPFFSTSMSNFWRRWHMSLIKWLTDYIYTPISYALRSKKMWGIVIALLITFLISGIWHGAALTVICWGLMQGILLSMESVFQNKRNNFEEKYKLKKNWLYVFACCVMVYVVFAFTEIYGMSSSFNDANLIVKKIFTERGPLFVDKTTLSVAVLMTVILFFKDLRDEFFPNRLKCFESESIIVRFGSYLIVSFLILLLGVLNSSQFIYFQF